MVSVAMILARSGSMTSMQEGWKAQTAQDNFKILLYCLECLCNPRRGGWSASILSFLSFTVLQVAA